MAIPEGLCAYYDCEEAGRCTFQGVTRQELHSLNNLEARRKGLDPGNMYRQSLLRRLDTVPSLAKPSELSGMLLCEARGFAGAVSIQTPIIQKGCDCYKPKTP